ncbi:MAG: FAD-dependent oxidoreductase [Burkholderiales bacterium]|nr:FAD-dependent oxidoreductase [Burkholderiales bacterium]
MTGPSARIAIVGGGLGGLLAAVLLQQQGVREVVLFEARERLGGRILTAGADGALADPTRVATDRFDLGPSWFWPAAQPQLDQFVDALGLPRVAQFEDGDVMVERAGTQAPVRVRAQPDGAGSVRLAGGMASLVAALSARLEPGCVRTGEAVRRIRRVDGQVVLEVESVAGRTGRTGGTGGTGAIGAIGAIGETGEAGTWRAEQVLLALPPRLAERSIGFDPPLPPELARRWRDTPTWMAPHAKYVAVYDTPFWQGEGLSGAARSGRGPMAEIHDASVPGGPAALFGFVGVSATVRRGVPEDVLRTHCRAQLARLFGERAATPLADVLKDWALDPFTATAEDAESGGQHAAAPPRAAHEGAWAGRLAGIGSEWSPAFPGYLAGAVDAAIEGVREAVARLD